MKTVVIAGVVAVCAAMLCVTPAIATESTINDARVSGYSAFVRNSWVQAGLLRDGTFGSRGVDLPVSGFESTTVAGAAGSIGLIADGNEDGFFEDGDFFLPGVGYEGWSFKVGNGVSHHMPYNPALGDGVNHAFTGTWITQQTDPAEGDPKVWWATNSDIDGVGILEKISAPRNGDHLIHLNVTMQNNSGSAQTVYYMRQVNPDNAVDPMTRNGETDVDYKTFNTIISNDATSQIVTGTSYYNFTSIGYRASDPDAIVRISDKSDPLTDEMTGLQITAAQLDAQLAAMKAEYKPGYQDYTDSTIDIVFRKQIAAGQSATIDFDYLLSPAIGDVPSTALDLNLGVDEGDSYAGADTELSGGGLMPNSEFTLIEHSEPRVIFSGTTLPNGNFYASTSLPQDCVPGSHTLILQGVAPDGSPVSDWVTYTVNNGCTVTAFDPYAKANGAPNPNDSPDPPTGPLDDARPQLANTGLPVSAFLSIAGVLALLGAGTIAVLVRRRQD